MAVEHQPLYISPIRPLVCNERNPSLVSDIRRLEKARVFDEKLLQRQRRFEADAEVAVVTLEHGKSFRAGLECRVAPGPNFVSFG